ncbi:MAG TPA: hypothetical protein VG826_06680 [Pirellulales bacterium]|nr:hypothetical protein [Pirellulales bacterium]
MRFRLKTIFIITFAVAVVCTVFFTLPDWLCLIVLATLAMVTPAALVAGIIYGRGAKRAFAIGCLVSGGWALWLTPFLFYAVVAGGSIDVDEPITFKVAFAAYYGMLLLAGSVSIGVRRLCYQGRNGIRPPRDCC